MEDIEAGFRDLRHLLLERGRLLYHHALMVGCCAVTIGATFAGCTAKLLESSPGLETLGAVVNGLYGLRVE